MRWSAYAAVGVAVAGLVWVLRGPAPEQPAADPPWEVRVLTDGTTRALGLTPGRSTLAEAIGRLGKGLEAGIFESPDRPPVVEAYYSEVVVGGISGRLILSLAASPATLEGLRARSPSARRLETGSLRRDIATRDADFLASQVVRALSFVPSANLDEATVRARFGDPVERIPAGEKAVRWLYPERGVIVTISEGGKEVIDYVAPADFAWLRESLGVAPATH